MFIAVCANSSKVSILLVGGFVPLCYSRSQKPTMVSNSCFAYLKLLFYVFSCPGPSPRNAYDRLMPYLMIPGTEKHLSCPSVFHWKEIGLMNSSMVSTFLTVFLCGKKGN